MFNEERPVWTVKLKDYTLNGKQEQMPVLQTRGTLSREEIAEEVAARIGKYETREVAMLMKLVEEVTTDALTEGYIVRNSLGTLQPGITGVWNPNRIDPIARAQNKAVVNFTMSDELKERFSRPLFYPDEGQRPGPRLVSCVDQETGSYNELITPGGVLVVEGSCLRFIRENEKHGVFFEDPSTRRRVAFIPAARLPYSKMGKFILQAPPLPPGLYRLGVVNQCTNSGRPVKNLRTAYLPEVLEVKAEVKEAGV